MDEDARLQIAFPDIKTRRGRLNLHYRLRAWQVLIDSEDRARYTWLIDDARQQVQNTILSELGRIENIDDMLDIAAKINDLQPRSKDAVRMIRRWRTGRSKPGNAAQLTGELTRLIDDYIDRHPDTPREQVEKALENTKDAVEYSDLWEDRARALFTENPRETV